ncbi:MAG: ribosome biogenesis GTPase Der [Candidatus Poribacteria bacterium]|nr:ribosome biogenesis GTPase Der [Candidatus Poribacteria bacterium]
MKTHPVVAIVGRPNVGKSSLFNCITKKRIAVVHDEPGVTRDRNYADVDWGDFRFTIVDTGGLDLDPDDSLIDSVQFQVENAIDEAAVILFVVDAQTGILAQDLVVADKLRGADKPILVVVNKSDNERLRNAGSEFYELGLAEPFYVSCAHNRGIGELLDEVTLNLPAPDTEVSEPPRSIKIAIVGRPNVGKSSIINTILGEERMIVDHCPGTTRDAVNIRFVYDNIPFELTDTAGMRRRSAIDDELEEVIVQRAIRSIRQSDIAWLILDATQEVARQDKVIASFIARQGVASILGVNKWDLIQKDNMTHGTFVEEIYRQLPQLTYVPAVFTSAETGQRVRKLLELSLTVHREYCTRVPTHALNELLLQLKSAHQPPRAGKVRPTLKYMTQIRTEPPTFLIFARYPNKISQPYESYLINGIRDAFGFHGTPIRIYYRSSDAKESRR